jgi:hypothetical protein
MVANNRYANNVKPELKMKQAVFQMLIYLLSVSSYAQSAPRVGHSVDVSNAGHRLHVTAYSRKSASSVNLGRVVFESGLGGGEAHWLPVLRS